MNTRLAHHINKSLGVAPREIFEYLNLIMVREDGLHQTDALVLGNGRVDQQFPGGRVTEHENIVNSWANAGTNGKLTRRGEFARLPKLLGVIVGFCPSTL